MPAPETSFQKRNLQPRSNWVPYGTAIGFVVLGWLGREALTPLVGPTGLPYIFFFPAVALASWFGGCKPGALAALLSALVAKRFFSEPVYSWSVTDYAALGAFVVSCGVIVGAIELMHRANATARAEFSARESAESRLAAVVEHSGDAIFTKNLDGIVLTWNASARDLFGYRPDEIVGRHVTTLFPPDRLSEEDHILHRLRAGQAVERFETIRVAKDGRRIPVSVTVSPLRNSGGEIIGASTVVHDIAALAAAREALVREKELLATTLASIGDAVIVTDAAGRVTFLNGEAERLTGWTTGEAGGRPLPEVFRIVNEQTRATVENPVEKVLRAGKAVGLANHTILLAKDGRETPIDDSAAPIRHENGPLLGVVLVFRDVLEQRKSEAELRSTAQELARSSRAKDDFLAALSHELRTPLTPVLMAAAALESDPALPPPVREELTMIRRNVELEARLIDDLLDITRISRGKLNLERSAVNIHQLLDHTAQIVRSDQIDKQIRLAFRLDAARHHVMADPARLHQVFWNLVRNALKFTPDGGRVTARTWNDGDDKIIVSVEDTGIGLQPGELTRIFNAFEQSEHAGARRAEGLGLGLAICKSIVEMHDGEIRAESRGPGLGAAFHVTLSTIAAPPAPACAPASDATRRSLRLLVVDDHQETLKTLTRLLSRSGHHVSCAGTVRDALALALSGEFDVLVSDLGLPDGSGLDLMRRIRLAKPIAGIALSGYGMPEDVRKTTEAGFFAHIVKPVDVAQLRQLLERIPDAE